MKVRAAKISALKKKIPSYALILPLVMAMNMIGFIKAQKRLKRVLFGAVVVVLLPLSSGLLHW